MFEPSDAGARHLSGAPPATAAKFFPGGGLVGKLGACRGQAGLALCTGDLWKR